MLAIFLGLIFDHYPHMKDDIVKNYWRYSSLILNTVFLLDLMLNFFFIGVYKICKRRKYLLIEIVLQLLTI